MTCVDRTQPPHLDGSLLPPVTRQTCHPLRSAPMLHTRQMTSRWFVLCAVIACKSGDKAPAAPPLVVPAPGARLTLDASTVVLEVTASGVTQDGKPVEAAKLGSATRVAVVAAPAVPGSAIAP